MSGTDPTPAEQHLGDRLAALVDGELKHDARERVLAHLATCAKCKAEAAAQRRLKSVFAQSAPPSPSEGFLARLQGLPGGPGGDDDGPDRPFGGSGRFADGLFPVIQPSGSRPDSPGGRPLGGFGFLPTLHGSTAVLPGGPSRSGFRIHEVGREGERSPWRGRRFAFAAASAVSLAAIALGGALPTGAGPTSAARVTGAGNAVTPLDAPSRGESGSPTSRRGGGSHGTLATRGSGERSIATAPSTAPSVAPTVSSATPAVLSTATLAESPFAAHVLTNVSAPPLIRPTGITPLFAHAFGRPATQSPAPSTPPSGTQSSPPPPWARSTASALPTPADLGLPLSSRR
ncbi:zf-HC2 domain-containing protein [Streptomyces sp. NBC_00893]|uniref:zf-HC2 domain-containing protein n=1 Tax=Streptomyces sp. NBC_00893 TaxID=2975862 RepID=UPI00225280E0|nr:zf-HC2 domain-containing protein [Streptomyces sp. NBC_00893]MCX4845444.1 zf-HC2 domain-containing protein [Streptomyces sp. NBC_00893]